MKDGQTVGILPLGRTTFDVPFAEEKLRRALMALDGTGHRLAGSARPAVRRGDRARGNGGAAGGGHRSGARPAGDVHGRLDDRSRSPGPSAEPLSIWAFPEPRTGGRLRLNAFCGLNLAAHALGLGRPGIRLSLRRSGRDGHRAEIEDLLGGKRLAAPVAALAGGRGDPAGAQRRGRLARAPASDGSARIRTGFDTCRYDRGQARRAGRHLGRRAGAAGAFRYRQDGRARRPPTRCAPRRRRCLPVSTRSTRGSSTARCD